MSVDDTLREHGFDVHKALDAKRDELITMLQQNLETKNQAIESLQEIVRLQKDMIASLQRLGQDQCQRNVKALIGVFYSAN